jgi:MPBQ/MSBQ methyltransferase
MEGSPAFSPAAKRVTARLGWMGNLRDSTMDNGTLLGKEEKGRAEVIKRMIGRYDTLLYDRIIEEYYGQSGFANLGYWDENTKEAVQACQNLVEKLLAMLPAKGGNILDLACGKGGTTKQVLKHFSPERLVGGNISQKQTESARLKAPGCAFAAMDASSLPFKDESFDNIICVEAAFHFYTREAFLWEACRVLKPEGALVLSDALMKEGVERRMNLFHEENYVRSPEEYAMVCRRAGFREVQIVDATIPVWEGHFWNVIRFSHDKYLHRQIDLKTMKGALESTYKIAEGLNCYLLVALRKGECRQASSG